MKMAATSVYKSIFVILGRVLRDDSLIISSINKEDVLFCLFSRVIDIHR